MAPADWNQAEARKSAQMAIEQTGRDFFRAVVDRKIERVRRLNGSSLEKSVLAKAEIDACPAMAVRL